MKPEVSVCKCGNTCEVKIASGQKKPENKGKKYTKCLKCDSFRWIEDQEPVTPPLTPQKPVEAREPIPHVPVYKPRDYDSENKGKVRHGLMVARTELVGLVPMTPDEFDVLTELTEIVITGKFPKQSEEIDEDLELPSDPPAGGFEGRLTHLPSVIAEGLPR